MARQIQKNQVMTCWSPAPATRWATPSLRSNDYRVLQPWLITDPNGNRSAVRFDTFGMVVATAVMGKVNQLKGDRLAGFSPDPTAQELLDFLADPKGKAAGLLGDATTRIVYDLHRYLDAGQPAFAATLAREMDASSPPPQDLQIQVSLSYSDGFGREIQKKIQAEPNASPTAACPPPRAAGSAAAGPCSTTKASLSASTNPFLPLPMNSSSTCASASARF